jgi:predicted TIM-barrel fold metal-dependent hydrolase
LTIPPQACDCHVHIFGPAARFPFTQNRLIVHPSPYGTDNSCTLDAPRRLGQRARGVAVIDAKSDLPEMQRLGVRGVRVNLQTAGVNDAGTARELLQAAADRVAPLGWPVQTFTHLGLLKQIEIHPLPVPLVIDHFGLPRTQEDVDYLCALLRSGKVYVKLSAPHRVSMDTGSVARALIAANPERCLWGTDWPHPFTRGPRRRDEVQPFDPIDDLAALERFHGWVGDAALFRKILVDNPARLYDF